MLSKSTELSANCDDDESSDAGEGGEEGAEY